MSVVCRASKLAKVQRRPSASYKRVPVLKRVNQNTFCVASVTRSVRELRGFERITVEPGQSRTVSFTLRPDDLAFYNQRMQRVVEPGFFTVWVGASSVDQGRPARFEVVGELQAAGP